MGKLVGAITGSTSAAKKLAASQREAGEMARYKPWDVEGSYFGDADFDYEGMKASYELSPELTQLRDMFMGQALNQPDAQRVADGQAIENYGRGMFTDATSRTAEEDAAQYYNRMQNIMAPDRATQQQQLAQNLFASGRMGQATAAPEGGGYVNPERMEYLTALNRTNNELSDASYARARQERGTDINAGIGYYGTGQSFAQKPYDDAYKMFGYGSAIEETGQQPFNQGIALGSAAQSGNVQRANNYAAAGQSLYNNAMGNIGLFTNIVGNAVGAGGNPFSNPFASGGGTSGVNAGGMQGPGWSVPIK